MRRRWSVRTAFLLGGLVLIIIVGASVFGVLADDEPQRGEPVSPAGAFAERSLPTSTVFFKRGLEADIYRPDRRGPVPAVLLVHGGGLFAGSRTDTPLARLAGRLRAQGFLAVSVDYTLGQGFEPASRDIGDALAWLRTLRGVDPDRIALLGQSAGADLVAYTAYQDSVRALVLASPAGGAEIVSTYGSPDDPETLVLRGADDGVPLSVVTALVEGLGHAGVAHEYEVVEGAAHRDVTMVHAPQLVSWLRVRLDRDP